MNIKSIALVGIAWLGLSASAGASTLLTAPYQSQLQTWLGATGLYSGNLAFTNVFEKTSGDTAAEFHAAADGKGPTITLMSVTVGNATQIIGGFNPQSWNAAAYNYHYTFGLGERTAFIFDLTTNDLRPQTSSLQTGVYQTYNNTGYGPTFGGGHDIYIDYALSTGYLNPYSYGNNCSSDGNGCYNQTNFFGVDGYSYMTVGQLEVFTISQVSAVPEASTWAMMLVGFAGLGFLASRRRSKFEHRAV